MVVEAEQVVFDQKDVHSPEADALGDACEHGGPHDGAGREVGGTESHDLHEVGLLVSSRQ